MLFLVVFALSTLGIKAQDTLSLSLELVNFSGNPYMDLVCASLLLCRIQMLRI